MPQVVSDIVDVYVFRRLNARVQFLLLQRKRDVALGQTWQSFHTRIKTEESTIDAAYRAVEELAGLRISAVYSADYVNQFFDDSRDVLVFAPVLAVNVNPQAPVRLDSDLRDCAWLDRDEATMRLPFSGQRWAVRHIDEIMSIGHAESELYRLTVPEPPAPGEGLATSADDRDTPLDDIDPGLDPERSWTDASTKHASDTASAARGELAIDVIESPASDPDDAAQKISSIIRTDVRPDSE
jgi:dATP pyrophosphohydrolase